MLSESAEAVLDGIPLLDSLPEPVRTLVRASFGRIELPFGVTVFERGDPADAYYVVAEGEARVLDVDNAGNEVPLNMLRRGDAFGDAGLPQNGVRTATVRASTPLTLLRLDGDLFRALVAEYPALAEDVAGRADANRVSDFLRLHTAFAALAPAVTRELARRLSPVELADGEAAVRQDEPADAVYLVEAGRLGVWVEADGRAPRRVGTLHAGELFGELAVLEGGVRTATVRAEGPVRLLALGCDGFLRLLEEHREFAARMRERAALYALPPAAPPPPADVPPAELWSADDPGLSIGEHGEETELSESPRLRRRFPFIRQIDEMDCGAACLAMICKAFGHTVSLTTIRHAVGTSTYGTTLSGLVRGGNEVGLKMRALKSSADRLDRLPLPAILHWKGNHWVVVYAVDAARVRVVDPAVGRRRWDRSEVEEHWSGFAALASPTPALADAPRGGLDLRWLWPFVRPHRRRLLAALVLALAASGLQMTLPVFSQLIIDDAIHGRDYGLLSTLAAAMLGVLAVAVGVTLVQRMILARVATRLDSDTLDFISSRLLRLPMRYFEARRTGDIARRLAGARNIRTVLVQNGVAALTAATQLLVAVTVMAVYSWRFALLFVACAPLYMALMRVSQVRLRPAFDSVEEGHARYQSRQIDAIRGIETVKALGAEDGLRERMNAEFTLLRDKLFRADVVAMVYEGLVTLVAFLVYAVFLVAGALAVLDRQLTLGELVSISGLVLLAIGPLSVLLSLWDQVQMIGVLLGRLQDVFEQDPEPRLDEPGLEPVGALHGRIRLRRLGFAYAGAPDRPILRDISLDVAPGMTVALVGRSGSGKSTLAKCLAGLLVPTAGTLSYDGRDVSTLRVGELRRQIGFVLQQPYVFDETIESNIAFGDSSPDPARVRRAAEIADAAGFIEQLPLGYRTRVGDSGLRLSGGQAQRIAIARAVYHEPPILVLDEATSALDSEAERTVKHNMDLLLAGRTAFVVAHRLSTVRDADLICVLEQGRLVESGTHESLLQRHGLYAYLHAQQLPQ